MPLRISCCHLCLSFSLAFDKFHYVFRLTYASNIIVTFYATPPIKPTHNWSTVYTHALSTYHVYYIYIYISRRIKRRTTLIKICTLLLLLLPPPLRYFVVLRLRMGNTTTHLTAYQPHLILLLPHRLRLPILP